MSQPMPASWRRMPITTPEYEWYYVSATDLPRRYAHCEFLIHHQRNHDVVRAQCLVRRDQDTQIERGVICLNIPQGRGAPTRCVTFQELCRDTLLPPLLAIYGNDRRLLGQALCAYLPEPLHHKARTIVRHVVFERGRENQSRLARAAVGKAPRVFLPLVYRFTDPLVRLGRKLDAWLGKALG